MEVRTPRENLRDWARIHHLSVYQPDSVVAESLNHSLRSVGQDKDAARPRLLGQTPLDIVWKFGACMAEHIVEHQNVRAKVEANAGG